MEFTMDQSGVVHQQGYKSKKVAERIGKLTAIAGALSRKPGLIGTGLLATSRTSMSSDFADVRKVKRCKKMHTILLNERFSHNLVYVGDDDFDFVYDFIRTHCPHLSLRPHEELFSFISR